MAGPDWWAGFYKEFPKSGGILRVSRAVLSEDGSHALIYAAHACDGLCGTGFIHYLVKDGASWRIEDSTQVPG